MANLSINTRVILLAVLPVTAVSIILFSVFITKQLNDIDDNLIEKGNSLAEHLSSASEFGIFSRNIDTLNTLIEFTRKQPEVTYVTILDENTEILAEYTRPATKGEIKTPFSLFDINEYTFKKPVVQPPIDINDFQEAPVDTPAVLGWVIVTLSDELAIRDKTKAIYNTLFLTLVILYVSGYIAVRIGRYISQPIITITNTVKEIEAGNLDAPLSINSTGELSALAHGIKSMTASLKDARHDYLRQIKDKTFVLEKSLKIVEKQNEDLLAARQEALAASLAKSEFLANMSHEIRTPMNGIMGYIRLLMKTNPSREQMEYLEIIDRSSMSLLTLLNDVIDLSKVEAGKLDIQNTEFSLRECIDDILMLMAPAVYEKQLEITSFVYEDTPDSLFGAPDRIRQILINLIGNAIKFSNAGTIVIRAMLEDRQSNQAKLKISVTDQGIGISKGCQEKIFGTFTQIDNTLTRRYEGAGLGLSISKSLAEAMGGEIGVESETGQGSTFWFTFTADVISEDQPEKQSNDLLRDKRVSIYDNNDITGLSLSHEFMRLGCPSSLSNNQREFFQQLKSDNPPDIIAVSLSHSQVETGDYENLIARIRKISNGPMLAFINSSDPSVQHEICIAGADICISKPHRFNDFQTTLSEIWHRHPDDIDNDQSRDTSPSSPTPASDHHQALSGLTILVAEDNTINAKLISTLLKPEGAKLIMAQNGREAIDLFRQYQIDLILMDIHMPELSGIDAATIIRSLGDHGRETPIIGLTANTHISEQQELINAGMSTLLTKPISSAELIKTILLLTKRKISPAMELRISDDDTAAPGSGAGISSEIEKTLREILIKELPETTKQIQKAYQGRQWLELQEICHKLLGGISYCNLPELKSAALAFHHGITQQREDLEKIYGKLLQEIEHCIKTG